MSKSLSLFAGALGGTVLVLASAYYLANRMVPGFPEPPEAVASLAPAPAETGGTAEPAAAPAPATEPEQPAPDGEADGAQATDATEGEPGDIAPESEAVLVQVAETDGPEAGASEDAAAAVTSEAEAPEGDAAEAAAQEPAQTDTAETAPSEVTGTATAEPVSDADATGAAETAVVSDTSGADAVHGLGRPALPEEIAAWDVDVTPDGRGLPKGSGDALTGEPLFEANCASCHGSFAEGVDNWPKLAGGSGTLADEDPLKTVGSYWPYLSTVWDYVHRSMPFGNAQSLTDDEVYAIVAYILYSNDLIEDDFVLDQDNLAQFEMPNAGGFIVDDRPETEYPEFSGEPCMTDCKDAVEITMRARVLDVTPQDEAEEAAAEVMEEVNEPVAPADTGETAAMDDEAAEPSGAATEAATSDPALVAEGETLFRKCKACHQVGGGATNKTGPHLNGVIGRPIASVEGFRYSSALASLGEAGKVWDEAELEAFLADPRGYAKGTKMSFRGMSDPQELDAIQAYLATFGE